MEESGMNVKGDSALSLPLPINRQTGSDVLKALRTRTKRAPGYADHSAQTDTDMKKLLLLAILVAAIAAVAAPHLVEFFRVDSCLDSGGRWNAESKECEH
jgi:hypothetical protein